jgi:C4-dicarboxylate-specific signal transduction histidine kinase
MTIRRLFQILFGTLLALVCALATIAVLLFINQRNLGRSQQIRFQSHFLAEELRRSGDDLTRFAQTYVVTGEPRYERYYWETLAIRNGQSPLPEHYDERNHWDFEAATERTPNDGMKAISLLQRLKEVGVTEAEFTKLKEMNMRSDALVTTEMVAFNALKGLHDDGTGHFTRQGQPDREMAIRLTHDEAYRTTKVNIMKPIDEFFAMLEARTAASMEGYQQQGKLFLLGILFICGLLILLALASFIVALRRIWTPVGALQRQTQMVAADMDRLAEVTNKIAAGELDRAFVVDTQPLRPRSSDEIGSLMRKHDEMIAHLQKTGNAIATLTATQKRTQESLRRARDQLEAKVLQAQMELAHVTRVTTLGEMTASIAHEINQPLAAIATNASAGLRWLARDSPDLTEAREAISRIIRDRNRASEVISRMRALFKKAPAATEPIDINEVVQEVLTLSQTELQRNRVSLATQFANDLPIVMGDKIQLQQVILNLVVNAIEAMSGVAEGPRELWVSSQKVTEIPGEAGKDAVQANALTEPESAFVLIAVRDSGPGLDSTELKRVFETFYTTKSQGMGMGLAISRSIIEAHHGRLWATANMPQGAVFQFTLPCTR